MVYFVKQTEKKLYHIEQKAVSKKATIHFKDQEAFIFIAFKALNICITKFKNT